MIRKTCLSLFLTSFALFAKAQSLEYHALPATNVEETSHSTSLGTIQIAYTASQSLLSASITIQANSGGYGGTISCSEAISFVENQYVVCTTAGAPPPTTLYIVVGQASASEEANLNSDSDKAIANSNVSPLGNPSVILVPPSLASYSNCLEQDGENTYTGTGGASYPEAGYEFSWNPTWTNIGGNQYQSSVCSIQSPQLSCSLVLPLGGSITSGVAHGSFQIPVGIYLTP